jgi:hypothetical protein
MKMPSPLRAAGAALAALLLAVTGCERGPTTIVEEPVAVREMIIEAGPADYIYSHSEHWHGAPVVREGETSSFRLHFSSIRLAADDHEMPPVESWFTLAQHPDLNLRVVVQDTTLARWGGDGVNGTLQGLRAGASVVSFVVRRGTTTIYEAPPLNFRVQARP